MATTGTDVVEAGVERNLHPAPNLPTTLPTLPTLLRVALIAVGTVSIGLGVLGIFLPLLPTTPFLLLAAACYARSSPRFYRWLMEHRVLGTYITDYRQGGMTVRSKFVAVAMLWTTIGLSAGLAVTSITVRILLLVIAAAVTAHVLSLRTIRRG